MSCQCFEGGYQPLDPTVPTQAEKILVLAAMKATGGVYDGAQMGLFINNVVPTANTIIDDLTQPTWGTYALGTITWSGTARAEGVGGAAVYGDSVIFTSDAPANDLVYGAFIVNGAGALMRAMLFDAPIPVVGAQDLPVLPALHIG